MKKSNFIIIAEKFADIFVVSPIVWIKILVLIFIKNQTEKYKSFRKTFKLKFRFFFKQQFCIITVLVCGEVSLEKEKIIMARMIRRIEKLSLSIV